MWHIPFEDLNVLFVFHSPSAKHCSNVFMKLTDFLKDLFIIKYLGSSS